MLHIIGVRTDAGRSGQGSALVLNSLKPSVRSIGRGEGGRPLMLRWGVRILFVGVQLLLLTVGFVIYFFIAHPSGSDSLTTH
jgi:hypothetical protein